MIEEKKRNAKKILFLSSKGGTGKTTIIATLGYMMATGYARKVGLIDLNFNAPYLPSQLGVSDRKLGVDKDKIYPVKVLPNLFIVSNEMMINDKESPIVMRNYMYKILAEQFLKQIDWGEFDYLFFDTPSVFSDEIAEALNILKTVDGVIIVTQSQDYSIIPLMRVISYVEQHNLPIMGIVDNMHSFSCSSDNNMQSLFRRDKFRKFIDDKKLNIIAEIPFDRDILKSTDNGISFVQQSSNENDIAIFKNIIEVIEKKTHE